MGYSNLWQINELIELVKQRYPDWDGFIHSSFVADEIAPKRVTAGKFADLLNESTLNELISQQAFDEIYSRLEKLTRDNKLLFTRMPAKGDAGILYHPKLDKKAFPLVMRNLLYGSSSAPQRLQQFADYTQTNQLPLKWAFPTYFLFFTHPNTDLIVKPKAAKWFLRFMGDGKQYDPVVNAGSYAILLDHAQTLLNALAKWGATDMIDLQSFLWVCHREGGKEVAGLSPKTQVALDIPNAETIYVQTGNEMILRERDEGESWEDGRMPAVVEPVKTLPLPTLSQQTSYSTDQLTEWLRAIERKKQAIFYGAPGTGKTYLAKKIARHLVGGGDGKIQLLQFHPAYSYEEFIQGIRPTTKDGTLQYQLTDGRFLDFCRQAEAKKGVSVLIIDEINRANLARVFGELMYLLEYREEKMQLASGEQFTIPRQLRILATMNSADRSIALVDYALRRRFAFISLPPNYNILRHYHQQQQTGFNPTHLIDLLTRLNGQIQDPNYAIGVSFFCHPNISEELASIWQTEIEPYLEEFFFNQPAQIEQFRWQNVRQAAK